MTTVQSASEHSYALILGVSSGFGSAVARTLAREGYHIIGVHLDRAAGMKTVEELKAAIEAQGVRALFFNANAADADRRRDVIDAIQQEFAEREGASVKVLLHSLAFGSLKQFVADSPGDALTQRQMEMTLDVMANSLIYWTQDLIFGKLFGRNGRIFAMTSAGSRRILPMYGAVSAAKAALESYIRQLALELAPYGITANSIRAGVTDTPALRKIPGSEIIINNALMRNPYHQLTTTEDVAEVIALLARPESSWINGTIVGADGGEDSVDLTWWKPE